VDCRTQNIEVNSWDLPTEEHLTFEEEIISDVQLLSIVPFNDSTSPKESWPPQVHHSTVIDLKVVKPPLE